MSPPHVDSEREPLLAPLTEPTEIRDALITGSQISKPLGSDQSPGQDAEEGSEDQDEDDTPLPMGQILWLCYVRLVEPIAFYSIFAFLNQMLWEIGDIGQGEVGYYAGFIVCIFDSLILGKGMEERDLWRGAV